MKDNPITVLKLVLARLEAQNQDVETTNFLKSVIAQLENAEKTDNIKDKAKLAYICGNLIKEIYEYFSP